MVIVVDGIRNESRYRIKWGDARELKTLMTSTSSRPYINIYNYNNIDRA